MKLLDPQELAEVNSLLTLELSRGARRDTLRISERLRFQEESELVVAA